MKTPRQASQIADDSAERTARTVKNAHSPAPWHVQEVNGKTMIACQPFGNGEGCLQIAEVTAFKAKGSTKANAHLIAAAPELLETLETIVEAIWDGRLESEGAEYFTDAARALICKAKLA